MKLIYIIKYSSKRTTITIQVDPVIGLIVVAQKGTTSREINQLLQKKENWIIKNIEKSKEILPAPKPKEFVSGERFEYIGRSHRLQVIKGDTKKVDFKLHS